jgi:hypothetical protein
MAFIVQWRVAAHLFENWPASKLLKHPIKAGILQGIIFWAILIIHAWLWLFLSGKPISRLFSFVETSIFVFAAWFLLLKTRQGFQANSHFKDYYRG